MPQVQVADQSFEWTVSITSEFKQLLRYGDPDDVEVLRIFSPDRTFDIAIRVFVFPRGEGTYRSLGPALVLGAQFPSEQNRVHVGIMIELRPKICRLPKEGITSASVERVIQWSKSAHFRPRRVNSSGGKWGGYGYPASA